MDSFAESLPLATLRIKYTTPQGDRWCQAVLERGDPFAWEDFLNDRFSIRERPRAYVTIIDVDRHGASAFVSVFEGIARQVRDRLLLPNGYQPEEVW